MLNMKHNVLSQLIFHGKELQRGKLLPLWGIEGLTLHPY